MHWRLKLWNSQWKHWKKNNVVCIAEGRLESAALFVGYKKKG